MNKNDLIVTASQFSVKESLGRLESILGELNVKIFARFNHGAEANAVELDLDDVEVLIFGAPKVGTYLMQENIAIAIELPLKVVAWSEDSKTFLTYKDPGETALPYCEI